MGRLNLKMLDTLNKHWGWSGLNGIEIVGRNPFGNLLVLDETQAYWRICPEELSCEIVAANSQEYMQLMAREDFQIDWDMSNLVDLARKHLGPLRDGWAYYLVIPSIFGGPYDASNIRCVPIEELIAHSGDWGLEVRDLPDGAQIKLRVID